MHARNSSYLSFLSALQPRRLRQQHQCKDEVGLYGGQQQQHSQRQQRRWGFYNRTSFSLSYLCSSNLVAVVFTPRIRWNRWWQRGSHVITSHTLSHLFCSNICSSNRVCQSEKWTIHSLTHLVTGKSIFVIISATFHCNSSLLDNGSSAMVPWPVGGKWVAMKG